MTTDRELKTLILDLTLKVMDLQAQVRRLEDDGHRRHAAMIEWSARLSQESEITLIDGVGFDEIEMPTDVADDLTNWLNKSR